MYHIIYYLANCDSLNIPLHTIHDNIMLQTSSSKPRTEHARRVEPNVKETMIPQLEPDAISLPNNSPVDDEMVMAVKAAMTLFTG